MIFFRPAFAPMGNLWIKRESRLPCYTILCGLCSIPGPSMDFDATKTFHYENIRVHETAPLHHLTHCVQLTASYFVALTHTNQSAALTHTNQSIPLPWIPNEHVRLKFNIHRKDKSLQLHMTK